MTVAGVPIGGCAFRQSGKATGQHRRRLARHPAGRAGSNPARSRRRQRAWPRARLFRRTGRFSIATLSFLGLGIQPPSADWGLAVADGYGFLTGGKWWVVIFNSAAIVSLVMATNLIAQGMGAFENSDR